MRTALIFSLLLFLVPSVVRAQFAVPDTRRGGRSTSGKPGFISTPIVIGGAVTLLSKCQVGGCQDENDITGPASGTLAITTPAASAMKTGQAFLVVVKFTGSTATAVTWTSGAGVTFKSIIVGDAAATAADSTGYPCPVPPATGRLVYNAWWDGTNFTFAGCPIDPPGTNLGVAGGGLGSSVAPTSAQVPFGNAGGTAYVPQTISQDVTCTSGGVCTVGKINNSAGTNGQMVGTTGTALQMQSLPFRPGFDFGTPTAGITRQYTCVSSITFPGNFTSSTFPDASAKASCQTAPSETDGYLIKVASTTIGAICLSTSCGVSGDSGLLLCTGGSCTTSCTGGDGTTKTCIAGQQLQVVAPGTVSGAGVSFTLPGHYP
jgi:hypothetical protein